MKLAILLLIFAIVCNVSDAASLRQLIGICVEECSTTAVLTEARAAIGGCPDGYECRSNGCGHTCQPISNPVIDINNCRVLAICNVYCMDGNYATDANGCPICGCASISDPLTAK